MRRYYLTLPSYYLGDLTLYLTVSITYLLITYAGRQAGKQAGHIVLHVHTYTTSIENSTIYLATVAPLRPFSSLSQGIRTPQLQIHGKERELITSVLCL